ncbi:hypothetical protein J3Q64DRAFT_1246502 [Phycomyces blakesleeanus]|uniref:RRM domain-containing protein n=1 Tax=Phycomyces blakesleeanus TaxID=4837 RepID=A0ABR3AQU6_PHYBL
MSYYEDRNRDSYRRGGSSRDGRGSGGLRRLYVGHVNRYVRERDLKDLFARTGRVKDCEIVSDFAFVEYEDPLDAEDAIREFDGYRLEGERLQVEFAKKGKGQDFRSGPSRGSSFGAGAGAAERCYNCGETGHM